MRQTVTLRYVVPVRVVVDMETREVETMIVDMPNMHQMAGQTAARHVEATSIFNKALADNDLPELEII